MSRARQFLEAVTQTHKKWYWCDRCRHWVWSDGIECPIRHFSTLYTEKPGSKTESELAVPSQRDWEDLVAASDALDKSRDLPDSPQANQMFAAARNQVSALLGRFDFEGRITDYEMRTGTRLTLS